MEETARGSGWKEAHKQGPDRPQWSDDEIKIVSEMKDFLLARIERFSLPDDVAALARDCIEKADPIAHENIWNDYAVEETEHLNTARRDSWLSDRGTGKLKNVYHAILLAKLSAEFGPLSMPRVFKKIEKVLDGIVALEEAYHIEPVLRIYNEDTE